MNHRITPLRRNPGADAVGQPLNDWVPLPDIWADVRFQTGAEVLRANAETSIVKASIRIRARDDIDSNWRVKYKKWTFEIKGDPLPDNKDPRFMFLVVESVK